MAIVNRFSKGITHIIRKYIVDIPDLTPEQRKKVSVAMDAVATYVATTVAIAAEQAAQGAIKEIKKGTK